MIIFCLLRVRIEKRSALVRELLSNNSLFVSQLYAALRARDLICFNTDLQTVNLLYNNSLLEMIYFLNIQYFQQCKVNGVISSV